jgi:hypothetical protein
LIREWDDEEANNSEDSGPFLKIESVVSLNPEAMGTEDVSSCLILCFFFTVCCTECLNRNGAFMFISGLCCCVGFFKHTLQEFIPVSKYNVYEWV